jgi:hypothetical protein
MLLYRIERMNIVYVIMNSDRKDWKYFAGITNWILLSLTGRAARDSIVACVRIRSRFCEVRQNVLLGIPTMQTLGNTVRDCNDGKN